jgi:hypothetical protein
MEHLASGAAGVKPPGAAFPDNPGPALGASPEITMTPPHLTPAPPGFPPRQRPAEVLDALAGQLRQRGLTHLYAASCRLFGVLSVSAGVTVWTNGRVLWWRAADDETTWPAADAPGAAWRLAELSAAPDP